MAYNGTYNTMSYLMRNIRPLSEAPEGVRSLVESQLLNENDESLSDVPDDEEEEDNQ